MNEKIWSIYLLYHPAKNRTYIGATTDPDRRLRQHNKEIVGGARSTTRHAPGWIRVCHIEGFKNRSEACRWEKLAKHAGMGLNSRLTVFQLIAAGVCPPWKRIYQVPEELTLVKEISKGQEEVGSSTWWVEWQKKDLQPGDIQPLQFSRRRRRRSVPGKRRRVGQAK